MTALEADAAAADERDEPDVVERHSDALRAAAHWEYFTWAPLYVCCWRPR